MFFLFLLIVLNFFIMFLSRPPFVFLLCLHVVVSCCARLFLPFFFLLFLFFFILLLLLLLLLPLVLRFLFVFSYCPSPSSPFSSFSFSSFSTLFFSSFLKGADAGLDDRASPWRFSGTMYLETQRDKANKLGTRKVLDNKLSRIVTDLAFIPLGLPSSILSTWPSSTIF